MSNKIPEKSFSDRKRRRLPPSDTIVLVGYYNKDQLKWIEDKRLYNIRIDPKDGLINYSSDIMGAKYLLLHGDTDKTTSKIFKIINNGPKLMSKYELLESDYPRNPHCEKYFVYSLDVFNDDTFANAKWNVNKLTNYSNEHPHRPFTVSLVNLFESLD